MCRAFLCVILRRPLLYSRVDIRVQTNKSAVNWCRVLQRDSHAWMGIEFAHTQTGQQTSRMSRECQSLRSIPEDGDLTVRLVKIRESYPAQRE